MNENYGSLSGAKFEITKGSKKIKGTDVNGNEDVDAFVSDDSGVFYIGMMDYGVYVLKETKTPDGYSTANPYYYLIVDDDGALMSDPSKTGQAFSTADAAKAAGDAKYKERENARKGSGQ